MGEWGQVVTYELLILGPHFGVLGFHLQRQRTALASDAHPDNRQTSQRSPSHMSAKARVVAGPGSSEGAFLVRKMKKGAPL